MQIEIYNMIPVGENISISLEAVCDSFSSLLWDIEYYKCGAFEVYIAASPRNIEIFQTGRIVGRDDDKEEHHDGYGENGDDVATGGMRRLHMRSSRQRSVEDRQKWICSENNSSLTHGARWSTVSVENHHKGACPLCGGSRFVSICNR